MSYWWIGPKYGDELRAQAWSQLSKEILVTGPQLGVTVTDGLSSTGGMADPTGGSSHPGPWLAQLECFRWQARLYTHPSVRFSEGMKDTGSGSALGIWGSRKHGIRVIQDFRAAKAESLPPSCEHHRGMVIGEVAATTAPLEQSVVIGWVIGLLAILPLWDDWQYLETFLIVKTGMGGILLFYE